MADDDPPKVNDWMSWLDRYKTQICGSVFLGFFLIYGALVYVAGTRTLTPLEQASMALIGVVVSAVLGVVLGIPLAKKRVRIASQLRRAYGIRQTLRNVQRDVDDATARMGRRGNLTDPAVVMEFWQEIAANIRVGLREPISAAERMVEDWGEMDPEERARIQAEEAKKSRQIEELNKQIQSAKSVEKDLEGVGEKVAAGLATTVDLLQRRVRELQEARPSRVLFAPPGSAKVALDSGHYREAVEIYDDIIRRHPRVHTNYIGRAKARYLAGDSDGALEDLKTARSIFQDDPAINKLEQEIAGGEAVTASLSATAQNEAFAGNEALASGDAEAAAKHFARAEELGWNPFFAKFNQAMAKCLGGEYAETEAILDELTPYSDSYMSINKHALTVIYRLCSGDADETAVEELRNTLRGRGFEYSHSPLRYLEAGLQVRNDSCLQKLAPVFAVLRSPSDAMSSSDEESDASSAM
jgi:tetratricopeptide (TPR) repeat protein